MFNSYTQTGLFERSLVFGKYNQPWQQLPGLSSHPSPPPVFQTLSVGQTKYSPLLDASSNVQNTFDFREEDAVGPSRQSDEGATAESDSKQINPLGTLDAAPRFMADVRAWSPTGYESFSDSQLAEERNDWSPPGHVRMRLTEEASDILPCLPHISIKNCLSWSAFLIFDNATTQKKCK